MTQGSVAYRDRSLTFGYDINPSTGVGVVLKDYEFTREVTNPSDQRSGQHGLWLSESFAGGLAAELTFEVMTTSQARRDRAINDLLSLFPIRGTEVSQLATLTFDFADESKSMRCRRAGSPTILRRAQLYAEVVVSVLAPEPWLLGSERSGTFVEETAGTPIAPPLTPPVTLGADPAGGTVNISPQGTAPAPAIITIYGPRDQPGVINVNTGDYIQLAATSLGNGDVLTIDLDLKAAKINDVYTPVDITSTWFELLPYETTSLQLLGNSLTSAGGQVTWREAFEA